MKTPKQWLTEFESHPDHTSSIDCICERCKKGIETFLLESDIIKIQQDAINSYRNQNDGILNREDFVD